jgi:hypothetical protein
MLQMMTTMMMPEMTTMMKRTERSSAHLLVSFVLSLFCYCLESYLRLPVSFLVVGPDIEDEDDAAEDFEPDEDQEDEPIDGTCNTVSLLLTSSSSSTN